MASVNGFGGRRRLIDTRVLAPLLERARNELCISPEMLADRLGTTARTVMRWEAGTVAPTKMWQEPLVVALADASWDSWRGVVEALRLDFDAMLAKVPAQAAKVPKPAPPSAPDLPPPHAKEPPAALRPLAPVDARAVLDSVVRAAAEDLDVSPRRVRAIFAELVVDLEKLGLSYDEARDALLGRGKRDGA